MRFFRDAFPIIICLFILQYANSASACPVLDIGGDTTVCQGTSVTFDAGPCWSLILWNTGENTQTITVSDSGMYVVWVMDSLSNTYYDTVLVTFLAKPDMQINPPGPIFLCPDESVKLDAKDLSLLAYKWSTGSTSGDITVDSAGSYYVVGWNAFGCPDTSAIVFVGMNTGPQIDLGNDTSICEGQRVVLDPGTGFNQYTWSDSNKTQRDTIDKSGIYGLIVRDANGCYGGDTISVTVNDLPVVNLGPDSTICLGEQISLSTGAVYNSYLWSTGDISPTIIAASTGLYFVQVQDSNGCTNLPSTIQITVNTPAIAELEFTNGFLVTNPGLSHQWIFENVPLIGETNNRLMPPERGNYQVITVDSGGCQDTSDLFLVNINMSMADIPEGFSPNGDAVNDKFVIQNLLLFPETSLEIVDRNGSPVFESDDYQNDWDGTSLRGAQLPAGTYYYVINPGVNYSPLAGYVILSR